MRDHINIEDCLSRSDSSRNFACFIVDDIGEAFEISRALAKVFNRGTIIGRLGNDLCVFAGRKQEEAN